MTPTKSPGSAEVRELEARRVAIVERWLARGENPPGLEDVSIAECALRLCADATAALLRAAHLAPRKKLLPESAEPPTHPSERGILNGIRDQAAVGAQAAEQGEKK